MEENRRHEEESERDCSGKVEKSANPEGERVEVKGERGRREIAIGKKSKYENDSQRMCVGTLRRELS